MRALQGRVVIVTGASSGIGRATAVTLSQLGAHLTLTARRQARLEELATELAPNPGRTLTLPGDIGDPTFAYHLVQQTTAEFGRVDVLINNAGVGHKSALAEMSLDDAQTIWQTNVIGLLAATQAAIPIMQRQGSGHIINVSSILGQRPLPLSAAYCASKTAVNYLSRSLRMELRGTGITVTLIYPGLTATEFADAKLGTPGANRLGLRGVPPQRVATKIAAAIRKNQADVYITPWDWAFAHLSRLFPRTLDWLAARAIKYA